MTYRIASRTPASFDSQHADIYRNWHWGESASEVVDWDDPDLPENLIEVGRFVRADFRAPSRVNPRRQKDTMLEFARPIVKQSYIAFDPAHPHQRLYLLVPERVRPKLAERFFEQNPSREMPLNSLASVVGGRHGKAFDYPNVTVKPVGVLTALVYHTHKKTDGPSYYIHQMAEESGHYPVLAAGNDGRLWIAGGNYTCPDPGITD